MIELSDRTQRLIESVIPAEDRSRITRRLLHEVSENIPFCGDGSPESMERIRFSVLRLIAEGQMKEDDIFRLAYLDWRDLFMAAGHGATRAHRQWAAQYLSEHPP